MTRLLLVLIAVLFTTLPVFAVDPPKAPPVDIADWTPRPASGKAEPWEKMKDPDWNEVRFRSMNTGPFFDATFQYPIHGKPATVHKGTAVRLPGQVEGGVLFDRNMLKFVAGWSGGYLLHSDKRFGLLNTPVPVGTLSYAAPVGPGWASPTESWSTGGAGITAPLPKEWAKYRGLHVHGNRVVFQYTVGSTEVLESASMQAGAIVRSLHVAPTKAALNVMGTSDRFFTIPASGKPQSLSFHMKDGTAAPSEDLTALTKPGASRWGQPIITKLVKGDDSGPLAVDTLTLPYDNPFKALFFCTGLDFMADGRVAMCTCHGDVWLAKVDETAGTVAWQRYATGLYHPLGLKVVDGKVVVLERGQLTRLHDKNNDGEADFYECVANDWDTGSGEHSYDTCLETDPQGNFYFFKTGDTHLPTGGCLMKVSKDGSKTEVFATGFRHPIGLGMSPSGIVTGADQEGNWMPATRIDQYKQGGFYGDMRANHRAVAPTIYDGPLCWVPREVDNSAGGQMWVPEGKFGPLGGLPIHFSYGRCKPFVLLRQEIGDTVQGGVWDLGIKFLSGVCRGRFNTADGNIYVCGLNGWQTAAQKDGCLQRVRYTGKPLQIPTKMAVVADGVNLTFSNKLDRPTVEDVKNYRAAWWNYRWVAEYGSKRYLVSRPDTVGQDDVVVAGAKLLEDERTVHVRIPTIQPVMQMQLGVNLKAADGNPVVGSVFLTIHKTEK